MRYTTGQNMLSQEQLSVALLLTLSSNAVLLVVLLLKSADSPGEGHSVKLLCKSSGTGQNLASNLPRPATQERDSSTIRDFVLTVDSKFNELANHTRRTAAEDIRLAPQAFQHVLLSLLRYKLSRLHSLARSRDYNTILDKLFANGDPGSTNGDATKVIDRQSLTDSFVDENVQVVTYSEEPDSGRPGNSFTGSNNRIKPVVSTDDSETTSYDRNENLENFYKQDKRLSDDQKLSSGNISRSKRGAGSRQAGVSEKGNNHVNKIFSTFTQVEVAQLPAPVSQVLIPALIQFEGMMLKEIESLRAIAVAHDLRLEVLEKAMLTAEVGQPDLQADAVDNKSRLVNKEQVLGVDQASASAGNSSNFIEMVVPLEGSGDSETSPVGTSTARAPVVTPWRVPEYYELFRHLSSLEQKILTLENFNVMSSSELTRVRSEVIKMDDKVTELDRRNRNLQIRMTMHAVKISELEMFKNKAEMTLQTSQESYGRVNNRLELFKDRLAEMKTELRGISTQFTKHDQISNELRTADAYKAHDIQEMRKNIFGMEGRLNNLYSTFDKNVQMVRSDVRGTMERLCSKNKLLC